MSIADINSLYDEDGNLDLNWLYQKYRGICWLCRKFCPRDQASRDHIKPKSLGGGPHKSNIALAHKTCNNKRGNGYKEFHFRHYGKDKLPDLKDVTIYEELGIIVQFWEDKRNGGFNVLVARKVKDI